MIWTVIMSLAILALSCLGVLILRRLRKAQAELKGLRVFTGQMLDAREKERKRIASELHSNFGQNLLIIKSQADLGLDPAAAEGLARQQLQEISKVCAETIAESRELAHDLGLRHMELIGLSEAIDAMVDRVAASTGVKFERRLEEMDGVLGPAASASIYRMAQEALNNMMKHAHSVSGRVELVRDLREVRLIVEDNGCGFNVAERNGRCASGFGLSEIAERAALLNGRLEIASRPGEGTRLRMTIPIADREV